MLSEIPFTFINNDNQNANDDILLDWKEEVIPPKHNGVTCAAETQLLREEIKLMRGDLIRLASRLTIAEQTIQAQIAIMQEAQKNCKRRTSITNILQELKPIIGDIPIPITTTTTTSPDRRRVYPERSQSLPWRPRAYTTYQSAAPSTWPQTLENTVLASAPMDTTGTPLAKPWHNISPVNFMHMPRMHPIGTGLPHLPMDPP